jgi:hypothetical protein
MQGNGLKAPLDPTIGRLILQSNIDHSAGGGWSGRSLEISDSGQSVGLTPRLAPKSLRENLLIEQLWVRRCLMDLPALSRAFPAKRRSTASCGLLSFHCS